MAFYDLAKQERDVLVKQIQEVILKEITAVNHLPILPYFSDEDTYIRKTAYLAIGKIYKMDIGQLPNIIKLLNEIFVHDDFKVRQTVVNAAGEIGKSDFMAVQSFLIRDC